MGNVVQLVHRLPSKNCLVPNLMEIIAGVAGELIMDKEQNIIAQLK
jgi:hypothetical protein